MSNQLSRRNFLKLGAAAAGVFATGQAFGAPQSALASALSRQNLASHVTIGNTSIQSNLNPYYFTYFQSRQIYDTLIDVSQTGELMPGLATEWNRIDGQTLELTLRDDVFFSNGERFTANSVVYTMNHLRTIGVSNMGTYAIPVTDLVLFPAFISLFNDESLEVIDDTHLIVRTTRPDAILEKRLSRLFVISEQHMTETDGDLVTSAAGTGYFRTTEFVPGERLELETWDGNWRGNYPIQTATYVRVGDPRAAIESGDIDIAQSIAPDIARLMVDSGNFATTAKPSLGTEIVSMVPDTHTALQDARVRRALNMAVDKDTFNEIIQGGFGHSTTGQLLQPGMEGYNEDLQGFAYDPDTARALLAEAGYSNLTLTMAAPNTLRAQAETVASFLEAIGVRIELETPDSGTLISEVTGGTSRNLILWNAYYTTLQDWSQAMVGLASPAPGAQRHFDNDEFYGLNTQISLAGDNETRNELIEQAAGLMHEEAAVIFLSWMDFFYVHSTKIQSMPLNLDNAPRIYAIEMLS